MSKKKIISIIVIVFSIYLNPLAAFSQDLTGKWLGKGSSINSHLGFSVEYVVEIFQDGNEISGTMTQNNVSESEKFKKVDLIAEFKGKIDGNKLILRTSRVISLSSANGGFCFTDSEVFYVNKGGKESIVSHSKTNGKYYKNDRVIYNTNCKGFEMVSELTRLVEDNKSLLEAKRKIEKVEDVNPFIADTYKNRKLDIIEDFSLKNGAIELVVWDRQKSDGDIISINLNGEWLLKNFKVSGKEKKVRVQLEKGVNYILFNAENVGRIPPNTASIRVLDNEGNRIELPVKLDMKTSQAIKITVE